MLFNILYAGLAVFVGLGWALYLLFRHRRSTHGEC